MVLRIDTTNIYIRAYAVEGEEWADWAGHEHSDARPIPPITFLTASFCIFRRCELLYTRRLGNGEKR